MSTIYSEFDAIRKTLLIKRINNELNDTTDDERKEQLNSILNSFSKAPETTTLGETLKGINQNIYKTDWHYLPKFHKISKIKEYVRQKFTDKNIINNVEELLTSAIKLNELNSVKFIVYDKHECRITDIPDLIIDKNEIYLKHLKSKEHIKI